MQKIVLPLILLIVLLLYIPTLSVYFSHDDFFHFKASQTDGTLGGFINLLGFHSLAERGYAFFRPIFREALFNVSYLLFGLNSLPLRILSLVIHLINIVLVYKLIDILFKSKKLALFTSFFFGISAANVGSLFYLAGGIQSLGATIFILLTIILFLNRKFLTSFFMFILALGSHELSIVTPAILFSVSLVKNIPVRMSLPFFVPAVALVFIEIFFIGFSSGETQYQITFSPKAMLNSFVWYSAWAFGFPEMFIDFIGPKFVINPNLMKFWGEYASGIFFFGAVASIILFLDLLLAIRSGMLKDKKFWFFVFWFLMALSPVVLLPLHKSTYYLNPALGAFWGLIFLIVLHSYGWLKKRNVKIAGFLFGAFMVTAIALSWVSVSLAKVTYPAVNRGRIAKKLIEDTQAQYPQFPKGAVIYFKNDPTYPKISGDWGGSSKQAEFALNGSDALQLVYKDPTLRVMYEDLDNLVPSGAYSLVAKIN